MNDVLADRFAAVADSHDDSDWKALRPRRRWPVVAAVVAAGVVAAVAVAAVDGNWHFVRSHRTVDASTTVELNGHRYSVAVYLAPNSTNGVTVALKNAHSFVLMSAAGAITRTRCQAVIGSNAYWTKDGAILFGISSERVRKVRVGSVTTDTVDAGAYLTRVWALATPGRPKTIDALDAKGHLLRKVPIDAMTTRCSR